MSVIKQSIEILSGLYGEIHIKLGKAFYFHCPTNDWKEIDLSDQFEMTMNTRLKEKFKEPEWRPIDSAPKDGTEILICGGVFATESTSIEVYGVPFDSVEKVDWCEHNKQWTNHDCDYHDPTHWMPLPTPKKP